MTLSITAHIYQDGKWHVAFCPEFPEANGQGRTQEECLQSLKAAIELLLEDRREDARKKLPTGAELVELSCSGESTSGIWKLTAARSSEKELRIQYIGILAQVAGNLFLGTRRSLTCW